MKPSLHQRPMGSDKLTIITILVIVALLLAFFYFAIVFKYFD